jgi:hypothetical protein
MTTCQTAGKIDFEALRRAIEGGAPEAMLGLYADDARLLVLDGTGPRFELRGKVELSRYLHAVFGRTTTHRVENEHVGHTRMTFDDVCEYQDGPRVVVATMLQVCGSEISRQVDVLRMRGAPGKEGLENVPDHDPGHIAEVGRRDGTLEQGPGVSRRSATLGSRPTRSWPTR